MAFRISSQNSRLSLLEKATTGQLLALFESALKLKTKSPEYSLLPAAWGILFSSLYLSNTELECDMQSGSCRLDADKEQMLREFIKADSENGGTFVLSVIKTGGIIDRSALVMIADLEDLARIPVEGTTALHMLVKACDKGVRPAFITKAGQRLLSSTYDHSGIPVLFLILSLGNMTDSDLTAIETVYSKEDLKKVMAKSRMGKNALQIFSEISMAVRKNPGFVKKIPAETRPKTTANTPVAVSVPANSPVQNEKEAGIPVKAVTVKPPEPDKPRLPDTPQHHRPPVTVSSGIPGKNMKILIVDDDEIIRELLLQRLKFLGYEMCTLAGTGDEAVTVAHEIKPDVVFMDINMPGKLDGVGAAGQIKAELKSRIIFLTAYSDDEILHRVRGIRPEGYITKPFSDTDLRISLKLLI